MLNEVLIGYQIRYMATCQGWSQCCTLVDCETEAVLGRTENHRGFMYHVAFNHDCDKLAQVDTGHTGAYEVKNPKRLCKNNNKTTSTTHNPDTVWKFFAF